MPRFPSSPARGIPDLAQWIAADRKLQAEIDTAMTRIAEGPPGHVDFRLTRVVATVLAPSWSEHVRFQEDALFPLIARLADTTDETHAMLARRGEDHADIGACQSEAAAILNDVVDGRDRTDRLGTCLARTVALRRRHHDAESGLSGLLPSPLDADDEAAIAQWIANRSSPPFPLNLLLALHR